MADVDQLLRAVFEVCEDTENFEPKNDFQRGRVFEAKRIRRRIGTWFQDEFCGRTHMGEPVSNAGVAIPHAPSMDPQRDRELADPSHAAFEEAMRETWQMIDPIRPPKPGTYYLGEHNGIAAALKTLRENYERHRRTRGVALPDGEQPK